MYIRTTKAGGHEYVQLAHNYRDPDTGVSKPDILYSFGRKDALDVEALKRLARSIARFLEPEDVVELKEHGALEEVFSFVLAKELGGPFLLEGIWRKLGLDTAFKSLLEERQFRTPIERLLFALVAQRALAPGSKLSLEDWLDTGAYIEGLPDVDVQQLYRAMDFLLEAHDEIQKEVFWQVRNLFNLEVDVILVDTTTTFFEIEGEDPDDEETGEGGLRKRGRSKDGRRGLAQAVIGFAVTKDGIPVRCWVWPGNKVDMELVEEIKRDLNTWKLSRVVMVMDTGFNSEENRRILQGAGDAYIVGEKMRLGPKGAPPKVLSRAGRYKTLPNGLKIKEVVQHKGSVKARRFVIVINPDEAKRDKAKREDILEETKRRLAELQQTEGDEHSKAACELRAHTTFGRFVTQDKNGKLRLDKSKIAREEKLDGKYLISTSDDHLTPEEIVMGYKQLHEIERVNRDLKHTVDVRPVYHRRSDRIKAHVLLCWLALLLIRVAENETGETWHNLRKQFKSYQVAYHATPHGEVVQTNPIKPEQKRVLDALDIKPPKRYLHSPTPQKA